MIVELAVAAERGLDLPFEKSAFLRVRQPPMAFRGVGIRLLARDAKQVADDFGRLFARQGAAARGMSAA